MYDVYIYIHGMSRSDTTEQETILRQKMNWKEEIKFFHLSLCFRENWVWKFIKCTQIPYLSNRHEDILCVKISEKDKAE